MPSLDTLARSVQELGAEIADLRAREAPTEFSEPIRVRLPRSLLARVRAYRGRHGLGEANAIRILLEAALREIGL